jgi:hypothetical protein
VGQRERRRRQTSAEREAAVREALRPLAPGERPVPVTIAAVVAALVGLSNLVMLIAHVEVNGKRPSAFGTLLFCAIMLAAAWGLWRVRYWAVLGFQALLALVVLVFALFLLRASNLLAVVLCVAVIGLGGWLFFKLIRAMARIQMPERPERPVS